MKKKNAKTKKKEMEENSEEGNLIAPKKTKVKGVVALKHKAVLDNLTKKVGKDGKRATMVQAMIDAGYSRSYAESSNIKTKKSWAQLMEEYLPDTLLADTHHELMKASKLDYMLFSSEISDEDIYTLLQSKGIVPKKIIHGVAGTHVWFFLPDNKIRKDAIELGYKVKGKMAAEKIEVTNGLHTVSDEELAAIIKKESNKLAKKD